MSKFNCKQISRALGEIKSKKINFEDELLKNNFQSCLLIKVELMCMLEKVRRETWKFEQEELSIEEMRNSYEHFRKLFEETGIVKNGLIDHKILSEELKGEEFAMPTEEQFLDFIISKEKQLSEMARLGLVEPVIVPIAAELGDDIELNMRHKYTGLFGVLAKKMRELGRKRTLKDSSGELLQLNIIFENQALDLQWPVYNPYLYKEKIRYTFRNNDGSFAEGLTLKELIQKHKEAGSPFPGFAIYFKEKGSQLHRNRREDDPLHELNSMIPLASYSETLRELGLTGSTFHSELILFISSLYKDGRLIRDSDNRDDAAGFMGGNTFVSPSPGVYGSLRWHVGNGQVWFNLHQSRSSYENLVCVPIGELI